MALHEAWTFSPGITWLEFEQAVIDQKPREFEIRHEVPGPCWEAYRGDISRPNKPERFSLHVADCGLLLQRSQGSTEVDELAFLLAVAEMLGRKLMAVHEGKPTAWVTADALRGLRIDPRLRQGDDFWSPLQELLAEERKLPQAQVREPEWAGFIGFVNQRYEWSEQTFGPAYPIAAVLEHLRSEIAEAAAEPQKLEEWVDIILLGLEGASRVGFDGRRIAEGLLLKQIINRGRQWKPYDGKDQTRAEHIDPKSGLSMIDCICLRPKQVQELLATGRVSAEWGGDEPGPEVGAELAVREEFGISRFSSTQYAGGPPTRKSRVRYQATEPNAAVIRWEPASVMPLAYARCIVRVTGKERSPDGQAWVLDLCRKEPSGGEEKGSEEPVVRGDDHTPDA